MWVSRASLSIFSGLRVFRSEHVCLAAVLGSSAVADSPFEVSLKIGFDEGVNGPNVSFTPPLAAATSLSSRRTRTIGEATFQDKMCVLHVMQLQSALLNYGSNIDKL